MPLIINGTKIEVNGLKIYDFIQDPTLHLRSPWNYRTRRNGERVQQVVMHSTKGWPDHQHKAPQVLHETPAQDSDCGARSTVAYWRSQERSQNPRFAGAHLVIDADGSILCCADLRLDAAYHAGKVNGRSVGIEVFQGKDSGFFRIQIDVIAPLVGVLCETFNIPRRACMPYSGPRADFSGPGVYGHRDLTNDRGFGDPGDIIMQALLDAGWDAF